MENDSGVSFGLRLKAAAVLVWESLRHPTVTSRITLDTQRGEVHVERFSNNGHHGPNA